MELKKGRLEKRYKDIFNSKDLIIQVREFDEQLETMKKELKSFDKNIDTLKDKPQKKIREF